MSRGRTRTTGHSRPSSPPSPLPSPSAARAAKSRASPGSRRRTVAKPSSGIASFDLRKLYQSAEWKPWSAATDASSRSSGGLRARARRFAPSTVEAGARRAAAVATPSTVEAGARRAAASRRGESDTRRECDAAVAQRQRRLRRDDDAHRLVAHDARRRDDGGREARLAGDVAVRLVEDQDLSSIDAARAELLQEDLEEPVSVGRRQERIREVRDDERARRDLRTVSGRRGGALSGME